MANTELEDLTAYTPSDDADVLYIVDVSAGIAHKVTVAQLKTITQPTKKIVGTRQTNNTTTGASITDLAVASVAPGTYRIRGGIIMQSAVAGDGFGLWVGSSGGTVTKNVGTAYTQTTGTTATTGVADQVTVAGTFAMIEGRSWRVNNTDPGSFGGVDTINSDQLVMLECTVVVTATTTLQIMFDSETTTTVSVEVGSWIELDKIA